jgi:hypothetical protein
MDYPKQVDEAAELAEELHAKMFGTDEAADEALPQEEQTDSDVNDSQDIPHDNDVQELRKFKEKYLHLQGKYDAEVPRLHRELNEFKQQVIERLTPKEQEAQEDQVDEFAKFKEEYGEDLYNTLEKLIEKKATATLKTATAPIEKHIASVEDTQVKAAQQNFVNYLDSTVQGDWQSLWAGKDPKFIEFLQQPDPSGLYTYGDLVSAYNDNWDADRLGKIFNTYFDNSQASVPRTKQPRPEQTAMVAPNRTNTHTTPSTQGQRIWTKDSMAEFQAKDRGGKYSPEESQAMWTDLLAAANEGRIR